jgi:hypothetical protein
MKDYFEKIALTIMLVILCWLLYAFFTLEPEDRIYDMNKKIKHYTIEDGSRLSKEKIYKRGLLQFLQKQDILYQRILEYRYLEMDYPNTIPHKPAGYYVLNDASFDDWHKRLVEKYDSSDPLSMEKIFFSDFNASKVKNIADFLVIDDNLTTAGMKKPVVFAYGDGSWQVFLDASFILKQRDNQYLFSILTIFLSNDIPEKFWDSKINEYGIEKGSKEIGYTYKIDDYGNVNYDIAKEFEEHKDLKGG